MCRWKKTVPVHPIKADALKPVIEQYKRQRQAPSMGMVFPVSTTTK
jgi:nitrate/nitrite transport system substrate-binding protein